jgi:chromosome partitioning protein
LFPRFQTWAEKSYKKKKTIFHAIEEYTGSDGKFDFGVNYEFIYKINERYHFVPSVEDLYWLTLDVLPRDKMQTFMRSLLSIGTGHS